MCVVSILVSVNCSICGIRKARRACPIKGEICSTCCGTEREQTIDCPLDCEFLRLAHEHEQKPQHPQEDLPNRDIKIDEDFLRQYEWVFVVAGSALIDAYLELPAATDYDAAEALAALVQTYRTLESGLVYESKPQNPYAAGMYEAFHERILDVQKRLTESGESGYLNDSQVLKLIVFMHRLSVLDNNGRKYSRAFLDMLNRSYAAKPKPEETLAEPEEPRIIL